MSAGLTKERILDAAEAIMLERSFHSVGLNQILAAVKVPKGSFYHYFESKEQFGVEMLRHYAKGANEWKRQCLRGAEAQQDPRKRLIEFFESVADIVMENGGKCPCLIQKLAAELADFSEAMRVELARSFSDSVATFRAVLDEAVGKGLLAQDFDTAGEAVLIQDLWCGAQQRASITRQVGPLHQAIGLIRQRLGLGT